MVIIASLALIFTLILWSELGSHFEDYEEFLDWALIFSAISLPIGIGTGVAEKRMVLISIYCKKIKYEQKNNIFTNSANPTNLIE